MPSQHELFCWKVARKALVGVLFTDGRLCDAWWKQLKRGRAENHSVILKGVGIPKTKMFQKSVPIRPL